MCASGFRPGYWGGWWDDFVNGLTNLMLAIPSLIFALAIMAILTPGPDLSADRARSHQLVVHLSHRSCVDLSLKNQGYVQAAKVLGYGDMRIMLTQILPNMLGPIIVIGTLGMGGAVLAEASLVIPRLGNSPALAELGQHVVRRARPDHDRALDLDLPRPWRSS